MSYAMPILRISLIKFELIETCKKYSTLKFTHKLLVEHQLIKVDSLCATLSN